jgi:large subunit ribosomal protein L35
MPKMKTKSSVKKRFSLTATGKIRRNVAGKQHGMSKRSNSFIRKQRGTKMLSEADSTIVAQFMPYGRK